MTDVISEHLTAELERFSLSLSILIEFGSFFVNCRCLFVTNNKFLLTNDTRFRD